MSDGFVDDLASSVRTAITDAATVGLTAFGTATALALSDLTKSGFVSGHAAAGGDALAQSVVSAFAGDLRGHVADDVDANGLPAGDARVRTRLVAFASGEAPSPVDDVTVEHPLVFALGPVAALEVAATLTLKAVCGLDAASGKPKTSTSAKIKLEFAWSSEPAAEA